MYTDVTQPSLLSGRLIIYDAVAKAITRSAANDRFDALKHKLFTVYLVEISHLSRIKPNIRGEHLFGAVAVFADDIYIERTTRAGTSLRDNLPNARAIIEPYAPDLAGRRIIIDSAANGRKYDSFAEKRSYSHGADVSCRVFSLNFRVVSELDVPVYSCRARHVKPRRMRRKTCRRRKHLTRRIFLKRHISGVGLSIYVFVRRENVYDAFMLDYVYACLAGKIPRRLHFQEEARIRPEHAAVRSRQNISLTLSRIDGIVFPV